MCGSCKDNYTTNQQIGYGTCSKAYRVYDPKNHKVHISHDVLFEEEKGWNWEKHVDGSTSQTNPFIIQVQAS